MTQLENENSSKLSGTNSQTEKQELFLKGSGMTKRFVISVPASIYAQAELDKSCRKQSESSGSPRVLRYSLNLAALLDWQQKRDLKRNANAVDASTKPH